MFPPIFYPIPNIVQTVVQPLAAEHNGGTFSNDAINQLRSVVARGDLGSSPDVLRKMFPNDKYPQFSNFNSISDKWWEHGMEDGYETNESFSTRAIALRTWLGSLGSTLTRKGDFPPLILLVSHGGILSETFQFSKDTTSINSERPNGKMQNCEIRVYDVAEGGDFIRPVSSYDDREVSGGGGSGGSGGASFVHADKNEPMTKSMAAPPRPQRPPRKT
jgi:hypothetical protein